jgi:hypothetical protein
LIRHLQQLAAAKKSPDTGAFFMGSAAAEEVLKRD